MTKNLGNRQAITRTKEVHDVTFEASATIGSTLDLQGISALAFVFPAEFNGDTITAKSSVSGDTGFTFTAATGRYTPTSDQALALAPMSDLILSTNNAVAADATVKVLVMY